VKHSLSPSIEIIQLRRNARFYKAKILLFVQILTVCSFLTLLYSYKQFIYIAYSETVASYSFFIDRITYHIDNTFRILNKNISFIDINGLNRIKKSEIIDMIYITDDYGNASLHNSLNSMYRRISSIPFVSDVNVRRVLSENKIIIDVIERNIIGVVKQRLSEDVLMIDEMGNLYQANKYVDRLGSIPLVENIEYTEDYIELYRYLSERNLFNNVLKMTFISNRRWNVVFKNSFLIKLPAKSIGPALDLIVEINKRIGVLSQNNKIQYIDLRIPGRIFIK